MLWSIQEIAKLAGTTSRTLRHYDETGLLRPSSIGSNGYRHYDEAALVRLQRILLLRQLGLGLPAIAEVLDNERDEKHALRGHLDWLRQEQDRLARQIASVELTIETLEGGEQLMAENMFDGFDHTQYKEEVEQRWGADAYAKSDRWWRSMSAEEKAGWQERQRQLAADWSAAAASGIAAGQRRGAGPGAPPLRVAARHPRNAGRRRERPAQGVPARPGRDVRRRRALRRQLRRAGRRRVRARRADRVRGARALDAAAPHGAKAIGFRMPQAAASGTRWRVGQPQPCFGGKPP